MGYIIMDFANVYYISSQHISTLTVPTHIKGQSSGATGFLRYSSVGTGFTAYDVKGTFFPGERLSFDGVPDNDRFTVDVHNYEISDIGSLYSSVGVAYFYSRYNS